MSIEEDLAAFAAKGPYTYEEIIRVAKHLIAKAAPVPGAELFTDGPAPVTCPRCRYTIREFRPTHWRPGWITAFCVGDDELSTVCPLNNGYTPDGKIVDKTLWTKTLEGALYEEDFDDTGE